MAPSGNGIDFGSSKCTNQLSPMEDGNLDETKVLLRPEEGKGSG